MKGLDASTVRRALAAVPAASAAMALGEHVRVAAATDRVAGAAGALLTTLVQQVERVVDLAADAQGRDTIHIEKRAGVVVREGSVEVSHGVTVAASSGGSRIFDLFQETRGL